MKSKSLQTIPQRKTADGIPSGIYRGVSLYVGDPVQIPLNGVRITTEEADKDAAVVEISTMVANRSRKKEKLVVTVKFEDEEHQVYEDRVHLTSFAESQNTVHQKIAIEKPKLWNCETPHLYRCTIQIYAGKNCWTNRNSHMESVRSHLMPCGDSGSTESR